MKDISVFLEFLTCHTYIAWINFIVSKQMFWSIHQRHQCFPIVPDSLNESRCTFLNLSINLNDIYYITLGSSIFSSILCVGNLIFVYIKRFVPLCFLTILVSLSETRVYNSIMWETKTIPMYIGSQGNNRYHKSQDNFHNMQKIPCGIYLKKKNRSLIFLHINSFERHHQCA